MPAQREISLGELDTHERLLGFDFACDAFGNREIFLGQLPLPQLPVHDAEVEVSGHEPVAMSEPLEERTSVFQIPDGLAPFARVLVLNAEVVERARFAALV